MEWTNKSAELLQRIIDAWDFGDLAAMDKAVEELRVILPDTQCETCDIGPTGHEYDCPNAQE